MDQLTISEVADNRYESWLQSWQYRNSYKLSFSKNCIKDTLKVVAKQVASSIILTLEITKKPRSARIFAHFRANLRITEKLII